MQRQALPHCIERRAGRTHGVQHRAPHGDTARHAEQRCMGPSTGGGQQRAPTLTSQGMPDSERRRPPCGRAPEDRDDALSCRCCSASGRPPAQSPDSVSGHAGCAWQDRADSACSSCNAGSQIRDVWGMRVQKGTAHRVQGLHQRQAQQGHLQRRAQRTALHRGPGPGSCRCAPRQERTPCASAGPGRCHPAADAAAGCSCCQLWTLAGAACPADQGAQVQQERHRFQSRGAHPGWWQAHPPAPRQPLRCCCCRPTPAQAHGIALGWARRMSRLS